MDVTVGPGIPVWIVVVVVKFRVAVFVIVTLIEFVIVVELTLMLASMTVAVLQQRGVRIELRWKPEDPNVSKTLEIIRRLRELAKWRERKRSRFTYRTTEMKTVVIRVEDTVTAQSVIVLSLRGCSAAYLGIGMGVRAGDNCLLVCEGSPSSLTSGIFAVAVPARRIKAFNTFFMLNKVEFLVRKLKSPKITRALFVPTRS